MKLSDFGLCKPLDCSTLYAIHENKAIDDENMVEPMDIDGCFPDADNKSSWKSAREQLQHWQMNRRKLVSNLLVLLYCINSLQALKIISPTPYMVMTENVFVVIN